MLSLALTFLLMIFWNWTNFPLRNFPSATVDVVFKSYLIEKTVTI